MGVLIGRNSAMCAIAGVNLSEPEPI